jgi:hypothetical protein
MDVKFDCADDSEWKAIYRAAVLEADEARIPRRIAVAEHALRTRGRKVFYIDAPSDEKDALETRYMVCVL